MVRTTAKRIFSVIVILAMMIVLSFGCNYLFVDDVYSITRVMMHELYEDENIDVLFLGASLVYSGIDPVIVGNGIDKNTFVGSSSAQPADASLAVLKEAVKTHQIQEVWYNAAHASSLMTYRAEDRTDLMDVHLISDYMHFNANRISLLLNASSPAHYMSGFFPAVRYRNKVLDMDYLKTLWSRKHSEAYQTYGYDWLIKQDQKYAGKGYAPSEGTVDSGMFYTEFGNSPFEKSEISETWKNDVINMIRICRENNIRFVLFGMPMTDYILSAIGNYDEYIAYFSSFARDNNVEFVDFNLLSQEVFPKEQSFFKDAHHLNRTGAEAFSRVLAEYMTGRIPDTAFVSSVSGKLEAKEPCYYGICLTDTEDTRTMRLVANHPEQFEFRIELTPEDGSARLLQDFGPNEVFAVPREESGIITVTYRIRGGTPVKIESSYGPDIRR